MGILDGRVAVVTGRVGASGASSRCAWRARARTVVVNDVGVSASTGRAPRRTRPRRCARRSRRSACGAVPNYDSVTDFDAAGRIIQTAVDEFGTHRHPREQRGHRARPVAAEDGAEDFDAVVAVHMKGTFNYARSTRPRT